MRQQSYHSNSSEKMSNYVHNRTNRASHSRRYEDHAYDRRSQVIRDIKRYLDLAREKIQNTELFPGLTEENGILHFTKEDVDVLRNEIHRIEKNQKNTNYALAFGSSLGVYSGGVAMAGFMVSVGSLVAATGGAAAVVGGISSVAASISRSRSEAQTKRRVESIVQKLNRLPDVLSAVITVSELVPGDHGIENAFISELKNLTLENLIDIREKTEKLVNVLSEIPGDGVNGDLDSIIDALERVSTFLNQAKMIIFAMDPKTTATGATVILTTKWLLQKYRGANENYRNALQLIEKAMIATPTIMNMLAKSGLLSSNWNNILKIASSSQVAKTAEKVVEEMLEKAGTKVSSKVGAEISEKVVEQSVTNTASQAGTKVAEKVGEELLEQASTKVAGKVGGEVLEQATTKVAGKVGGEVLEQATTKVAGKVGGEVLEQATTKVAGKVGGEVLEQATNKVAGKVGGEILEQTGSAVVGQGSNKVVRKVGEEVAEQAATSSKVSGIPGTAASMKYIRVFCASLIIAGIVVDGVTLTAALRNLYHGSPTDLSNFLTSLADVLESFVS